MATRQAEHATGLPPELGQAPLRTVRPRDVKVYAHPRQQLARLEHNGLLHRMADGFFAVTPQDRIGTAWIPTLEGAAAGIAAVEFGIGNFTLMGLTAARLHGAVHRATAFAVVAAPRRREELRLTDRRAIVRFVLRDLRRLQAERMATDMGACLVTTPEQTVLDLAHLPGQGDLEFEVWNAIRLLLPRCSEEVLKEIATDQRRGRALDRVRARERRNWG